MTIKRLFLTVIVAVATALAGAAHDNLMAFISDADGDFTNLRSTPRGALAMQLPTDNTYMVSIQNPRNGWWEVDFVAEAAEDYEVKLTGSPTGKYWIHNSVIALASRNYGGQRWCLRAKPSKRAAAVYYFTGETLFHPLDVRGYWLKVRTFDGLYTGWIELEDLCDNPLTTCP